MSNISFHLQVGLIFGLIVLMTVPNLVQHKIAFVKRGDVSNGSPPFDIYYVEYADFILNKSEDGADHPLVKVSKYITYSCIHNCSIVCI